MRLRIPVTNARRVFLQCRHNGTVSRRDRYVPEKARTESNYPPAQLQIPSTPTFFSGRSPLLDTVYTLERIHNAAVRRLHELHVTPLPKAAKHAIPSTPVYWASAQDMSQSIGSIVKTGQYRRIVKILADIHKLRSIAAASGCKDIWEKLNAACMQFEKPRLNSQAGSAERKAKAVDGYGRCYALGRRKTSSARVWAIRIQPEAQAEAEAKGEHLYSQIMVNGLPAATYFQNTADRERVFRPLQLTGLLTAYNVFALARGGGSTGQSEAIAMGLARCLKILERSVKSIIGRCESCHVLLRSLALTSYFSKACRARPENGRTEEDQPSQSKEKGVCPHAYRCVAAVVLTFLSVHLGQTMKAIASCCSPITNSCTIYRVLCSLLLKFFQGIDHLLFKRESDERFLAHG
jgi:small subunit ribosomal protein S9